MDATWLTAVNRAALNLEYNVRVVAQLFAKQIDSKGFWFDSSVFRQFWVVAT